MSPKPSNRKTHRKSKIDHQRLDQVAAEYQAQYVIPHCASCSRPCCMLTDVVLEFDWRHFIAIYKIDISQRDFDKSLRNGSGPTYVRKMDGIYYTHGAPCPAYNQQAKTCTLYNSDLKPENCSDFPVYRDGDELIADTRCEAVKIADVLNYLQQVMSEWKFKHIPDDQFPVINRIVIRSKN